MTKEQAAALLAVLSAIDRADDRELVRMVDEAKVDFRRFVAALDSLRTLAQEVPA